RRRKGVPLIVIGLLCIAIGAWNVLTPGDSTANERFGAWTVLIFGGVLLAMRVSDFGRSYAAELASGRVASVDGVIRVRHVTSNRDSGGSRDSYYYEIAGREFATTEEGANLIDPRSWYRIYYLPDSDIVVNIEAIAGPAASRQDG